ncbi:MAG: tetratricopeptide repeat protein [Pirellulaceae bacterium]
MDEACDGHPELRDRVEALLRNAAHASRFLESPPRAEGITIDQPISEKPGAQIGPYKLLQQIGEGGMGVVFMAEQTEPIQRKVALKVIKPGMDSRQVIARFEAERQALAMMDHVNIARVLDAGTTEHGRPYFVMELVHGVPITNYCDDNRLTPRQRLELFVPVCQAIQHAHQKGIIHRDIKPSNVMITLYDGKPVPKVIDFGVAKATEQKLTERTLFTQYGTMVGTLEYMSPEQAEMSALGVDTRSDIYSLGVLLYELLTGSTPLSHKQVQEAAYAEILRMIKEEEPPKPSTRLSESGAALASIAALRHMEPAKLSKLMRGELDWIVMKTLEKDRNRRYETANGFAADVQRYLNDETVLACPPSAGHRLRTLARRNKRALATAAVLALAVLVVAAALGWAVRDRKANAQEVARERAAHELAMQAEINLALQEAERWQAQGNWPEALSAAKRAQGLLAGGGSDELREPVHQLRHDLEMVLRLEDVRLLSSYWKDDKFDDKTADRAYAQAFGDYGIDVAGLPVEDAAARIRARAGVAVALAAALDDWAFVRSQKDEAGGLALTALAQAADPDLWRRQVRQAVQQKDTQALVVLASSPELSRQPPTSLLVLERALRADGQVEAAIEMLRQAQRQYPGDFWINCILAENLSRLGPSHCAERVSFHRAALAVRPQSTAALHNLGHALSVQGKLDEAIAYYHKAIDLDPNFAKAYNNLGYALKDQGKLDEAIACYRKAIELNPKAPFARYGLGNVLENQGKRDEAIACYRTAIGLDPKYAAGHRHLGAALFNQWKLDEAIAEYRQAIELDPKSANAHCNLGLALMGQGKPDEASAEYRQAIELDPKDATTHFNLGHALRVQGKLDEAIACFNKAIELDPNFAVAHSSLGYALDAQGKLDEAIACYRKAIELNPKDPFAHYGLGNVLKKQGKLDEAIACYRTAIGLNTDSAHYHNRLGTALYDKRLLDEAIAEYRQAIELDPKHADAYSGLGFAMEAQGKLDEAIASYRRATELDPKSSWAHNALVNALAKKGWELANCPDPELRDPKRGVEANKEAVELAPQSVRAWQYLGWVQYRAGNWKASIEALEESCKLENGGDRGQWIVMSLAHGKLANDKELPEQERDGHTMEARRWYDQTAQQIDSLGSGGESVSQPVRAFRAEAAEMLGIPYEPTRPPPPSPEVREVWRGEMERRAKALKLARMDRDEPAPVELLSAALHRYDDPDRDLHEATLWAWGRGGRPVALAAMEFYSRPAAGANAVYELVSLADGPLRAEATAGAWHWSPQQPGVVLQEFPGAGAAANTEIERLKQMQDLTKQLTAWEVVGPDLERVELSLLAEPVHRYADAGSGLLDGAILIFTHGSNPEIVLLVEARGQGKSGATWHYGLARLSSGGLSVSLGGQDVWKQAATSLLTPQESYWTVLEPYIPK